jgi:hypothetical protein
MKTEKWIRLFFIALVAFAVILVVAPPALADDGHGHNHHGGDTMVDIDNPVDVNVTGGDTNVPVDVNVTGGDSPVSVNNESRALALSNALGDVDIAGCLGSTQWATPLFSKQKLVVNWPCLAEFYLEHGKYELAAMAICNTEIVKEFAGEDECEAAHDFAPPAEPVSEVVETFDYGQQVQNDEIEQVKYTQMELMARIDGLQALAESRASRPRPRPAPTKRFTDEQKQAVFSALGISEDEE